MCNADADGSGACVPAVHYASHTELLQRASPGIPRALDGIVVSTTRTPDSVIDAFALADSLNAEVVVLCSDGDALADYASELPNGRGFAVTLHGQWADGPPALLPAESKVTAPTLETSRAFDGTDRPRSDLSRKRNLGLVLARLAGWDTLMFLDDDIRIPQPTIIDDAVTALDHSVAVGFRVHDFADNSIVCHARRLAGCEQDVFVGASALAINVGGADTFFPDVYNEDWLFLAPFIDRRTVSYVDSVTQDRHNPFAKPRRARFQEFGDVLAEGLVGFLHEATLSRPPSIGYWSAFLAARADVIASTLRICGEMDQTSHVIAIQKSLRVAERVRSKIKAIDLTRYIDTWLDDLVVWQDFVTGLASLGDLRKALEHLDFPIFCVRPPDRSSPAGAH